MFIYPCYKIKNIFKILLEDLSLMYNYLDDDEERFT